MLLFLLAILSLVQLVAGGLGCLPEPNEIP